MLQAQPLASPLASPLAFTISPPTTPPNPMPDHRRNQARLEVDAEPGGLGTSKTINPHAKGLGPWGQWRPNLCSASLAGGTRREDEGASTSHGPRGGDVRQRSGGGTGRASRDAFRCFGVIQQEAQRLAPHMSRVPVPSMDRGMAPAGVREPSFYLWTRAKAADGTGQHGRLDGTGQDDRRMRVQGAGKGRPEGGERDGWGRTVGG
eukprot:1661940-Rhodomonas_salina.1